MNKTEFIAIKRLFVKYRIDSEILLSNQGAWSSRSPPLESTSAFYLASIPPYYTQGSTVDVPHHIRDKLSSLATSSSVPKPSIDFELTI
jgi:hypothetical protein